MDEPKQENSNLWALNWIFAIDCYAPNHVLCDVFILFLGKASVGVVVMVSHLVLGVCGFSESSSASVLFGNGTV